MKSEHRIKVAIRIILIRTKRRRRRRGEGDNTACAEIVGHPDYHLFLIRAVLLISTNLMYRDQVDGRKVIGSGNIRMTFRSFS